MKRHLKIVVALGFILALGATGCGKKNQNPSPTPTQTELPVTNVDPTAPTDENPNPLDGKTLVVLQGFEDDITPEVPSYTTWFTQASLLRLFWGSVMPSLPTQIEAGTTGFKMIHRTTSGEVRVQTRVDGNDFYWADFVSIPNTGVLTTSAIDMIFSAPVSEWAAQYGASYSLVRVTGTISGSTFSGKLCMRTVAQSDFIPSQNAIGKVFARAKQHNAYQPNSASEVSSLRLLITCTNSGDESQIPNLPVNKVMGEFTTPAIDVLP